MFALCQRIATEKDRVVFLELVRELNDLLGQNNTRLAEHDQVKAR